MKHSILIVDDVFLNRYILTEMLSEEYNIYTACNGAEAVKIIDNKKDELVIIILDIIMPVMSGYQVMEYINDNNLNYIPVIIISTETSSKKERQAFDLGASDFIKKPFDESIVKKRVDNIIKLFMYQNNLKAQVEAQVDQIKIQNRELKKNKLAIIDIIGAIIESRNLESAEHVRNLRKYTKIIATKVGELYPEYGLTPELIEIISNASALHDIGKIAIPDNIILKSGSLTPEEFEIMKTHTTKGCDMIRDIKNLWDDDIYNDISYNICRFHHEKFNGTGYPDRLKGDNIPIEAQIVSIADIYNALINEKGIKIEYSNRDGARNMITSAENIMFSPKIIKCFNKAFDENLL